MMKDVRHILVFRFSALGDVAMTVPVIRLVLHQNPHVHITYVSSPFVQPLFEDIDRLHFFGVDVKGIHKGLAGMYRLSKELRELKANALADLHNVLRTKMLRFFLSSYIKNTAVINKGRKEKAALTTVKNKKLRQLTTTFQRYADVFIDLGLDVDLHQQSLFLKNGNAIQIDAFKEQGYRVIGLAPFAKHAEKMYPLERMKEVVGLLAAEKDVLLFLFGSKTEAVLLESWADEFPSVRSVAGTITFSEELHLIAALDLMISMDSANMHFASLYSVPVVSVWGATHPFAGFYGWKQEPVNAVQVDLYCRPCSVFGNRKCYRGDHACMQAISAQMIYDRVVQQLYKSRQ